MRTSSLAGVAMPLLLRGAGNDVNQKQGRPVSGPTQPKLVLRPGLEPGHLAAHAPQACVSAIPPLGRSVLTIYYVLIVVFNLFSLQVIHVFIHSSTCTLECRTKGKSEQRVNVLVFHRIKKMTGEKYIWLRATGSTLVSQFIDSFVVLFVAFYIGTRLNQQGNDFVWPFDLFLAVGMVNYLYKFFVALLMTPVIYGVHSLIEKYLGKELAASMKAAAMKDQ